MSWIRRLLGALGISQGDDPESQAAALPAGPPTPPHAAGPPLGAEGARLAETLRANGIDPAALEVLVSRGEKSVHGFRVHGSRAIELWRKLRGAVDQTACWPVLLGKGEMGDALEGEKWSPERIIDEARGIDASSWFDERKEEEPDVYELEEGAWPERIEPASSFQTPHDVLRGKPLPEVRVALVPTRLSWEAPAYLNYGGWNECPAPEAHVALMKRWHDLYGAEVVCIADDVVEMQVSRPPSDRKSAMELAREHFIYCSDIVHQGTGSLERLAATLLGASVWYFWWD